MKFTIEVLGEGDTMLMGKEKYLEQAAYWPSSTDDLAPIVNGQQKDYILVHSRTCRRQNSRLATGTPAEEIAALKAQPGKGIGVSGGARFARSLLADGLIDELRLTVHPVVLGAVIPLFTEPQKLTPVGSHAFGSGAVVHTYRPA
jgi:dihydrofolate reductase